MTQGNVGKVRAIVDRMFTSDESVFSDDLRDTYLFPFILYVPMVLHILYGAPETACKHAPGWTDFEGHLRTVVQFLSSKDLRELLTEVCLADAPEWVRAKFVHWSGEHLEWRWNHSAEVLDALDDRLDHIFKYFSAKKMKGDTSFKEDENPQGASRKQVVEK